MSRSVKLFWVSLRRFFKWEFWPWQVVYLPVAFYWMYLSLKARALAYFSAANPGMKNAGFIGTSKSKVLSHFEDAIVPKTVVVDEGISIAHIKKKLDASGLQFPLVAKPDEGERGKEVRIVRSWEELADYLENHPNKILIQEFIDFPLEVGVMYYRMPEEEVGNISSIVIKDFPTITGDGKSTMEELLWKNERSFFHYKTLTERYRDELDQVLDEGEKRQLVEIGNHVRGTTFLDGRKHIDGKLVQLFNEISRQHPGFYFGRYDIRAKSIEDLKAGKNFKIMELNGTNSEPAHIYDPKMPLLKAWRDLFRHWKIMYDISIANHKNGVEYMGFGEMVTEVRRHWEMN